MFDEIYIFIIMMKASSILISVLVLFQSVGISLTDAFQFDELLEHARYHKEMYGDSFISFISKHYGDLKSEHEKQHQEEREQHDQLPFNQHCCGQHIAITLNLHPVTENEYFSVGYTPGNSGFHYDNLYRSLFQQGIFQPPRQA